MIIEFAPMEGVTDVVFRRAHFEMFGGVDRYFLPFISPTSHLTFSHREQEGVSPLLNRGIPVVPQILTRDASLFLQTARLLADAGYEEVNLNLGCPSGTVTAKGKGSGFLRDLDGLRAFLDEVFEGATVSVSIKTRIGYESADEWPGLYALFRGYPLKELIVHPRTRAEFYKGEAHRDALEVCADAPFPVVYNGDLFRADDARGFSEAHPEISALMMGRGLVANPALAREAKGGARLTKEEARAFHDRLLREYLEKWPRNAVVGHMQEFMYYMGRCFENAGKAEKLIRKASTPEKYMDAVSRLFDECPLASPPAFSPR